MTEPAPSTADGPTQVADAAAAVKKPRSKLGVALVVFGYAIPLPIAVLLLFLLDDIVIAVALVCVEMSTVIGIHLALRAPQPQHRRERLPGEPVLGLPGDRTRRESNRDMRRVMTGMIGIVLLLAAVAVLASHAG